MHWKSFPNPGTDVFDTPSPNYDGVADQHAGIAPPGVLEPMVCEACTAFAEHVVAPLIAPIKWIVSLIHSV